MLKELKKNVGEPSLLTDDKDTDCPLREVTVGIKRPKLQIPPIKEEGRTRVRSNKQEAQLSSEYLTSIFQSLTRQPSGRKYSSNYK